MSSLDHLRKEHPPWGRLSHISDQTINFEGVKRQPRDSRRRSCFQRRALRFRQHHARMRGVNNTTTTTTTTTTNNNTNNNTNNTHNNNNGTLIYMYYIYTHISLFFLSVHIYIYIYFFMYVCMYIYIYIYIHIRLQSIIYLPRLVRGESLHRLVADK